MSAIGTKQTSILTLNMSASEAMRTSLIRSLMSANDPKQTLRTAVRGVTPTNARRHLGWLSFDGGVPEEGRSTLFMFRQARLHEIKGVAVEDCRVSEGISQPPRL